MTTYTQTTLDGSAPPRDWLDRAQFALDLLRDDGREFSADDFIKLTGPPDEPNQIGAWFRAHSSELRCIGYRKSSAASRRGGLIRVWIAR